MKTTARTITIVCLLAVPLAWATATTGCSKPTTSSSTASAAVEDTAISDKVRAALAADQAVDAARIQVETTNGVVHLKGTVNTTEQRTAVELLVRGVAGVHSIENHLEVKNS